MSQSGVPTRGEIQGGDGRLAFNLRKRWVRETLSGGGGWGRKTV